MPSMSWGCVLVFNSLLGIYSRTYIKMPPPYLFRSNLYGFEKPGIRNCPSGKLESNFVSVITNTSILSLMKNFKLSNLLEIELILRLPMT